MFNPRQVCVNFLSLATCADCNQFNPSLILCAQYYQSAAIKISRLRHAHAYAQTQIVEARRERGKSHETETFSLVSLLIGLKTNANLLLLLLLLLSLYMKAHVCMHAATWIAKSRLERERERAGLQSEAARWPLRTREP